MHRGVSSIIFSSASLCFFPLLCVRHCIVSESRALFAQDLNGKGLSTPTRRLRSCWFTGAFPSAIPAEQKWPHQAGPFRYAKSQEAGTESCIPGSCGFPQLFAFIAHGGPPTNNHAERSQHPLVIFRKVCMGTRSTTGSENISVFASLTPIAALQGAKLIDMFRSLFQSSPKNAEDVIFGNPPEPNLSGQTVTSPLARERGTRFSPHFATCGFGSRYFHSQKFASTQIQKTFNL